MSAPLTLVCWNFENNGKSDPQRRRAGDELLRSLNPDIVFRQELWDAGTNGSTIFNEQVHTLGLHGVLGEGSCTALFYNPAKFAVVRDWTKSRAPQYVMLPTALTLRYDDAGPEALPFIAVSYHLNYASAEQRLLEAEWLTTWADKGWATPDGRRRTLPAIFVGDNNSYTQPGTPGDLAPPDLASVKNKPHRLHRSYAVPSGERVPDIRPDVAFRTAGLEDAARFCATTHGNHKALARTVNACETHGPDSRVDRAYLTPELLPTLAGFEVIEVNEDLSDHHILRLSLDGDLLAEALTVSASSSSG
ncbi:MULTISPECIES: endonuclease/exonuclease/phosphatase family protein [Streptomyces]|uniref:endonuclease/exonuclease/phosphatase family protein n=1 Tax=Streptomyces TaxID=1883 RepID=UPI0004C0E2B4|nr:MULTISPECIES: endonuclease/exonuclease/phosphatase family protein [Streptomyces]MDX3275230.1 endonuclease/exonuclease/phosphatase family protein [Streptomyces scabiei]MDX3847005.1 endonuclease/exonuclease/phosphatase family protein [Streptomyces europaeiscabiei]